MSVLNREVVFIEQVISEKFHSTGTCTCPIGYTFVPIERSSRLAYTYLTLLNYIQYLDTTWVQRELLEDLTMAHFKILCFGKM